MTFQFPGFTRRLHLDYETASEVNLKTAGAHKYAEHHSTRVLMLGWAFDDEPEQLWQPHLEPMPDELLQGLLCPHTTKPAYNAQFERLITKHVLGIDVPIEQWRCTMVCGYYLGFAGGLDQMLAAVGLPGKDKRGNQLINLFCSPAPRNHKADWYTWENKPYEWEEFCEYCRQDVRVERRFLLWMMQFPVMHGWDWTQWFVDQQINDRGVPMDTDMAYAAVEVWGAEKKVLTQELLEATQLPKVTRDPFKAWMNKTFGVELESLTKDYLQSLLHKGKLPEEARYFIDLWAQKEGKAVSKYTAVINGTCDDGRAKGMFQYKGASRTDRAGGRRIQLQNLKRSFVNPTEVDVHTLVNAIKFKSPQLLRMMYPQSVSTTLGGSIRHVIGASPGKTFAVCDLTSIESVVLGWISQCPEIDRTYRDGRDAYKMFATKYYGIGYEEVTKAQRSFSKPPVLGCFAADTKVLTLRGWVNIVEVYDTDLLYDGVEWVRHGGVVHQGRKEVVNRLGVSATHDHRILMQQHDNGAARWKRWGDLTDEDFDEALSAAGDDYDYVPTLPRNPFRVLISPYHAEVYDVVNCGPRSRFAILTSEGPVIAHNCGFMLGWKGLIGYAEGYGVDMTQEQAKLAVDTFRNMYPEIPMFWKWIYDAVKYVTTTGETVSGYRLTIERDADFLRIWLPSGRALSYYKPEIRKRAAPWSEKIMTDAAYEYHGLTRGQDVTDDQLYVMFLQCHFSDEQLVADGYMQEVKFLDNFTYMGQNDKNQWVRISAHAGGVTENIVQSIAGDFLWNGIMNATRAGLPVILHVHDEIAVEVDCDPLAAQQSLQLLERCMTTQPAWAQDMWLGADGYVLSRYVKD